MSALYEGLDPYQVIAAEKRVSIMSRLSDRAFKVIELEIASLHNQGIIDKLDSIILSSRLTTLQAESGKHLTRAQIWDNLCDVIPDIEPKVLTSAAASGRSLSDVRISVGVGATAVLVASTLGMESTTASIEVPVLSDLQAGQEVADRQSQDGRKTSGLAENPILKRLPLAARFTNAKAMSAEPAVLKQAKGLGWQASLKGKNPPHSSQHWRETAKLWRQALVYLNQVPKSYADYAAVEEKIAFYQRNLSEIEGRQTAAIARERAAQIQNPAPGGQAAIPNFSKVSKVAETDYLAIARRHGWQASVDAQDAPHPARQWASVSRTWKKALHNLEQVSADSAQYEEAQRVKATYQQNLAQVREHYRKEQAASQSVASLQAVLDEIERSGFLPQVKQRKAEAIAVKLRQIPVETNAYLQAQEAIATINAGKIAASY